MYSAEKIKQFVSIERYLQHRNIPVRIVGSNRMFSIRNEKIPSCKYQTKSGIQVYIDYGTGQGGSVIDLEMAYSNTDFKTAVQTLGDIFLKKEIGKSSEKKNTEVSEMGRVGRTLPLMASPNLKLRTLNPTNSADQFKIKGLEKYAFTRGILRTTLRKSIVQFVEINQAHYYLAIPNIAGGYDLRNKYVKACSLTKDISVDIQNKGKPTIIVEGMFDYLTLLQNIEKGSVNYIVTNSCVNLKSILNYIQKEELKHIVLALDPDKTGRKTSQELSKNLPRAINFTTHLKEEDGDLNEQFTAKNLTHILRLKKGVEGVAPLDYLEL